MGCVSIARSGILINSFPSPFFSSSKGIQQGCPLSRYLFILTIEGHILLLRNCKATNITDGVDFVGIMNLTHIVFVDDVLVIGKGLVKEW